MGYSFFEQIGQAPADAIFQLGVAFEMDTRPCKVNLSVGLYRNEELQTPVLKTVKLAEQYLLEQEVSKEYLPISGDPHFIAECGKLVFGDTYQKKICGMQVPGGTGGLRIAADFIKQMVTDTIAIPDPTWPNHAGIFRASGLKMHTFPYYDVKTHRLNTEAIFHMLETAPKQTAVLFHACCHNPTGADLSTAEWNLAADIIKKRALLPFFDFAYQGLGKGLVEDAEVVRTFMKKSLECVVVSSYSKNFGLYSERVGAVFITTCDEKAAQRVLSQMKIFARTSYSNPPKHGAAVVEYILSHEKLKHAWMQEVDEMRHRLEKLRHTFVKALNAEQKKRDFSYLLDRVGMFCYLGLEKEKVERLKEEYGIYMAEGGRINLAGLCMKNFDYVIKSMVAVL